MEECEWYVLSRFTNAGIVGYSQDSDRVSNLANVFPVIFFLVAALACLTTMTRMVEEQRTQIGSLKAMGFSRLSISAVTNPAAQAAMDRLGELDGCQAHSTAYLTRSDANPTGDPRTVFLSQLIAWLAGALVNFIAYKKGKWSRRLKNIENHAVAAD